MIRHLTYHVYAPKGTDCWKWNLQQLAARAMIFNGERIFSVAVDAKSEDSQTVMDYLISLGMSATRLLVVENDPVLREVVAWPEILDGLNLRTASFDEVVFTAHSKGVSHPEFGEVLRSWADLMYRACLDDIPAVDASLKDHIATGAFRRIGDFWLEVTRMQKTHQHWHYSGTFFWWKPAELGRRNFTVIDRHRWGLEAWIGKHCRLEETGCLFMNNCENLYDPEYWTNVVWPAWRKQEKENAMGLVLHPNDR